MSYSVDWTRFVRRYALTQVAVSVAIFGAKQFLDYNLGSSGATVVPIILASMLEGRDYARAEGTTPKGGWAWQQALMFGLIALAISMAFAALFMSAFGGPLGTLLTPVGFAALSSMTGLMAIIFILGARLFFFMGARSELKTRSRE